MKKIYLYPAWLRIWHWTNAVLAFLLIITGISIYYPDKFKFLFPFSAAIPLHNVLGILLTVFYLFFFLLMFVSGEWRQYLTKTSTFRNETRQLLKYYFFGIFYRERYPFEITKEHRLDSLKKLFYIFIIFVFTPVIILTGILLLFSYALPAQIAGVGSIWLIDIIHIVASYIFSIMVFAHIYFALTGSQAANLTKAMIRGWFVTTEQEEQEQILKERKPLPRVEGRIFPASFYNPFTLTGLLIALVSFFTILFLLFIETFSTIHNAYLGIVTFLVLPGILVAGLVLVAFGIFREHRRLTENEEQTRRKFVIDLNNPKQFRAITIFVVGSLILVLFSAYGSYNAYEYTESDEFCGTVCHKVMHPEYTMYLRSPHSRVGCVQCHIGSGAGWFVKSKLSGTYQLYAVMVNNYPRPIPTPVENLRPAQETCEQCHWPKFFYDEKKVIRDYYLSDEKNTKFNLEMSIKVGGGNPEVGNTSGIHWHMNLANEIEYYYTDRKRNDIPWVKAKSRITGQETVYYVPGFKPDIKSMKASERYRVFDCIDCHSRPSHQVTPAEQAVNQYMSLGRINPSIPYIKQVSVQAIESHIGSTDKAYSSISNFVWNFYNYKMLNLDVNTRKDINSAIQQLDRIYKTNYFPEMNVSWREYQNNIGHLHAPGCFRCHDGNHRSPDGKVLTNDCNTCHTFKTEMLPTAAGQGNVVANDFIHPGGETEKIKTMKCFFCHGVSRVKGIVSNR